MTAVADPSLSPPLTRFARAFGLGCLEATSLAVAGWVVRSHEVMPDFARSNVLPANLRRWIFVNIGVALFVVALAAVVIFVWKRRSWLGALEHLTRRLAPLALAAFFPFLFDYRIWQERDLVVLPIVTIFGFATRAAFRTAWSVPPLFPALQRVRDRLFLRREHAGRFRAAIRRVDVPLLSVLAGVVAYAWYFSAITINNHHNLGTTSFDLGLENNLMWNLVHGGPIFKSTPFSGPTGTHFGNHATFISYVLAPVYFLSERPETMLIIQATVMGAAALPLFLYARLHVSPWLSALVAWLYLAYPPLQSANLYDFHYLPLGVFFLWLTLYAAEARRPVLATLATLLTLSVREDVANNLAVVGVFLVLVGTAPRAGLALTVAGTAYFIVMKMVVMPHFAGGESFLNQYSGLLPAGKHSFVDVIKTVIGNVPFTANVVFEHDKLVYLFEILAPLMFVPATMPIGFLLLLPGFFFTLLATGYWPLYQPSFQYTSYWTTFVFIGVVLKLEREKKLEPSAGRPSGLVAQRSLAMGLFMASLASTYLNGAVLQHQTVRGGFGHFKIGTTKADLEERAKLAAVLRLIPPNAKICSTEHLVPQVSSRRDSYTARIGVFDAEYLLLNVPMSNDERDRVLPSLRDGTFGIMEDKGDIVLAKRGYSTEKNAAVIGRARR